MNGQVQLKNQLNQMIQNDKFPRFVLLIGEKGSGKKTLAKELASELSKDVIIADDVRMSTLKVLIDQSYSLMSEVVYIIPDIDDMSLSAKNSLLKVLEEPPNKAYWILTICDSENTLPTIMSRASRFYMQPYSLQELKDYLGNRDEKVLQVATNPGEIDSLCMLNFDDFDSYVDLVIDNIAIVSGANAFKIGDRLSLKKDSVGYDLGLFWKAFQLKCMLKKEYDAILITSRYLAELGIRGINKVSLFDMWVLDIRKAWMYGDISS